MNSYLESGNWLNRSRTGLLATAIGVAVGFILFCLATEYFVAQYFVCIGSCHPGNPPFLLIAVSALFALIPALGTGVIGYWIVKGLWDDARQVAAEEAERQGAQGDPARVATPGVSEAPRPRPAAPRAAAGPRPG